MSAILCLNSSIRSTGSISRRRNTAIAGSRDAMASLIAA